MLSLDFILYNFLKKVKVAAFVHVDPNIKTAFH